MGLVENCLPNRKMRKEKKFNGRGGFETRRSRLKLIARISSTFTKPVRTIRIILSQDSGLAQFGFPRKAKKYNGKVRREAPHITVLS